MFSSGRLHSPLPRHFSQVWLRNVCVWSDGSYAHWKYRQKPDCFDWCPSQEPIFSESVCRGLWDLDSTPCLLGLWARFGCAVGGLGWAFDLGIIVSGAPAAPQAPRRSGRECSGIFRLLPHGSVWSKRAQPACSDPLSSLSTSTCSPPHSSTSTSSVVRASPHHPHHPTQPSPIMWSRLGCRGVLADRSPATLQTLQCESDAGDPVWTLCSLTMLSSTSTAVFTLCAYFWTVQTITHFLRTFPFEFTLGNFFNAFIYFMYHYLNVWMHLNALKCVSYVRKCNRKIGLFWNKQSLFVFFLNLRL